VGIGGGCGYSSANYSNLGRDKLSVPLTTLVPN
jgi:hypothetical protein